MGILPQPLRFRSRSKTPLTGGGSAIWSTSFGRPPRPRTVQTRETVENANAALQLLVINSIVISPLSPQRKMATHCDPNASALVSEISRKRKFDTFDQPYPALPTPPKTPPKTPPPTNVCEDCLQLDIAGVLREKKLLSVGTRLRTLPRNKCPLCFMLSIACILWQRLLENLRRAGHSLPQTAEPEGDVLIGLQFLGGNRLVRNMFSRDALDINSGPMFLAVVPVEHAGKIINEPFPLDRLKNMEANFTRDCGDLFGYPVVFDDSRVQSICVPRPILTHFDPRLATSWIRYCEKYHKKLCSRGRGMAVHRNLFLVDCDTYQVVAAPNGAQYVALSYVWKISKQGQQSSDTKLPSQLPSILPLVVKDSIKVTKLLGYRYLWIDKYCIDQNDAAMKHIQIRHMDSVYETAEITIIAASGIDEDFGLPGVSIQRRKTQPIANLGNITVASTMQDPHTSIRNSRWATRGWTYQEAVLSRRRLVFTSEQIYFECNAMNCWEGQGPILDDMHTKSRAKFRDSMRPGIFGRNEKLGFGKLDPSTLPRHHVFLQYLAAAEQYTCRSLSYDSDSLNAFLGIT